MTMTATPPHTPLPHPRWRLPILGDLLTIDMAKPSQGLARDIVEHGGIVEQRIFDFPVIVLSRTDLINEVNDEAVWEKHVGHSLRKLRPVAGDGLFTAYNHEPNWAKAHNILLPAFTKSAMESYHRSMVDTVSELVDVWSVGAPSWVDVASTANRLTTEIVGRAGIGHSFTTMGATGEDEFTATVLREMRYANRRTDAIPGFDRLFGKAQRRRHVRDKAWLREQIAGIISARRAGGQPSADPNMLDLMLDRADPDTGEKLDDANIANQILTLLVAGSETSANAISFALHYLAQNPDIAHEARTEIDERWGDRSLAEIGFDDVAPLRSLRRIVDESLRLWPVAPGYFRQAKVDTVIGGKYPIPAGGWVFVLLVAAQRDTDTWGPDAAEFRPDRFIPENLRALPPRVYKPFGVGPRACIGRQFALHEVMLTLAAILRCFEFEPEPGYRLEVSEALTLKPVGLRLEMRRR